MKKALEAGLKADADKQKSLHVKKTVANRAARMVEEMEAAGVVSAMQSNGSREVLAPEPPKN